jgi:hypothetical protein
MAETMAETMAGPHSCRALAARAAEVTERFAHDRVMADWHHGVTKVVGRPLAETYPAATLQAPGRSV